MVKNGVPFDLAFKMDHLYSEAMAIQFNIFEGGKFNIDTLTWKND